jgi:FkbM family methyltransferase
MFLISTLAHAIQTGKTRRQVQSLCREHGIILSSPLTPSEQQVFLEVFHFRRYSLYFPFYRKVVVLDIGAHKGFFSLFAALNAGPGSRIIALEPSSENFSALTSNIASQGAAIEAFRLGVAGTTSTQDLFLSRSENFSLYESYAGINEVRGKTFPSEKVEVLCMADLFSRLKLATIDFLKLDCEGAEYPFLFEAPAQLLKTITTISMEFHDLKRPDFSGNALVAFLQGNGFRIVNFTYSPAVRNNNEGKLVATRV